MLIVGCINFLISVGFIVIYTIYVIVVVVQSKNLEGDEEEEQAQDAMKFAQLAASQRTISKAKLTKADLDKISNKT